MMNRYALLLTAALGMAAAQTAIPAVPASATPAAAPRPATVSNDAQNIVSDPQLSEERVSFEVRRAGSDLASTLIALAMSAGYEIIIEPSVDSVLQANSVSSPASTAPAASGATSSVVSYSFKSKPFNEVWPLVLDIYGLSYESLGIGGKTVLRVGVKPLQKIVKLPASLDATATERQLKLSFGSLRKVTSSQTNAAPATTGSQSSATTTEASQEEIILDSPTMRIVAEPVSNSIIIRGTNQEVAQVERLLGQIIAAQVSAPAIVKPASIPVVQRVYTVNGNQTDVVDVLAKQYPTLNVSPVGTTGKVVLSGPEDQITAAVALLSQVDRSISAAPTPDNQVQVYSARGKADDVSKFLAAQYPGLKVTPIGTTERLVISGAQDQLSAALALLDKVDVAAPNAAATVQRVFTLVNASAEAVKATLEGTLARDVTANALTSSASLINPVTGQPYTSGNLANLPLQPQTATQTADAATNATAPAAAQPATIIADTRTNTVIVRGTSEQVEQVAALIPQLDQKVPQINVQVRIQEITETAARSLGMDWKVGFGGFQVSAGSGGLGASFDPTRSLVGFNVLPSLNALQNQGLSKSVYDGSITMQSGQRALDSASQTQNASGAAAASIKSGGRLEINIPSAAANVPGIQKQIDYGVNLDFYSPQVAPDGSITLRVRGQVNDLRTAITADTVPNILQFVNSEAQTTLTFKNGETLLLSGLLKTVETKNNDGVPFLSSLPVVGGLFGRDATRKEQTQLLVVITGNIVK